MATRDDGEPYALPDLAYLVFQSLQGTWDVGMGHVRDWLPLRLFVDDLMPLLDRQMGATWPPEVALRVMPLLGVSPDEREPGKVWPMSHKPVVARACFVARSLIRGDVAHVSDAELLAFASALETRNGDGRTPWSNATLGVRGPRPRPPP